MTSSSSSSYTWVWHGFHDELCTPLAGSIDERLEEIHSEKPKEEWALRERLLKPIEGQLPEAIIRAVVATAQALEAWHQATYSYKRFDIEISVLDHASYETYCEVRLEEMKVRASYLPEIEALHAQECPDCPWDGETIFPRGAK